MGIYQDLDAQPIINLYGLVTHLGGSLVEAPALEAMIQAVKESVRMDNF